MTVEHLLQQLASDNRSGAAELLGRSVELFERLEGEADRFPTTAEARRAVIDVSVCLLRSQPCMATLINLACTVIQAANSETEPRRLLRNCATAAHEFSDACRSAVVGVAQQTARIIGDGTTILTHSRSSTVLQALERARVAGKDFGVILTESRPMAEGLILATELAEKGIRVTLIADAAAASVMEQVSVVLVGADLITPRSVLNKIGTRMIALAAGERSIPIYAVADSSKFINPRDLDLPHEPMREPGELWSDARSDVVVLNRYFEETPLDSFAGVITEEGLMAPEVVRRRTELTLLEPVLADALEHS